MIQAGRFLAAAVMGALAVVAARAAHGPAPDEAAVLADSDAVFRGRVEGVRCVRGADGRLYTEAAVAVDEVFKGRTGEHVLLRVPGGRLDGEGEVQGCGPQPEPGAEYIIAGRRAAGSRVEPIEGASGLRRLRIGAAGWRGGRSAGRPGDARLAALRNLTVTGALPGADLTASDGVTREAMDGMSTNSLYGAASRFLACDRGQAIPYLVDMAALPTGITSNQAMAAVDTAFAAWSAVTSLVFTNEGRAVFGMGADQVGGSDRRIRVQLHDTYNRIAGATTLGIGGRTYRYDTNSFPAGGLGARVGTNEFDESTQGYVILKHTNVALQVLATFEEVLAHEVGHVLSLSHTSEDPDEADPVLNEALMYYRAHGDGRGAAPTAIDVAHVRQAYPADTPPWSYSRILDVVTGTPAQPTVAGINELFLPAYDRQGTPSTGVLLSASSGAGNFTFTNGLMRFVPNGYYEAPRLSPGGGSYYDQAYVRFLEASNASPPIHVRVISLQSDTAGPSDGLPEGWMWDYFGHADPQAGDLSRAGDDRDGDGHANIEEFRLGTDPTNALSGLRISAFDARGVRWTASPYLLYEIEMATNLPGAVFSMPVPVSPTGTAAAVAVPVPAGSGFFRIRRVP